jgi:hypothetical protein
LYGKATIEEFKNQRIGAGSGEDGLESGHRHVADTISVEAAVSAIVSAIEPGSQRIDEAGT